MSSLYAFFLLSFVLNLSLAKINPIFCNNLPPATCIHALWEKPWQVYNNERVFLFVSYYCKMLSFLITQMFCYATSIDRVSGLPDIPTTHLPLVFTNSSKIIVDINAIIILDKLTEDPNVSYFVFQRCWTVSHTVWWYLIKCVLTFLMSLTKQFIKIQLWLHQTFGSNLDKLKNIFNFWKIILIFNWICISGFNGVMV